MSSSAFSVRPIGTVHVDEGGFRLDIHPEFTPALEGVSGFSHLVVLFWCHLVDSPEARDTLQVEKPYRKGPERMGIFGTRSPARPNAIGLSTVQVLRLDVSTGTIHVPYLDAEDGTPILDIKPYTGSVDRIRELGTPAWCAHWPQWVEESADFDWGAEFTFA